VFEFDPKEDMRPIDEALHFLGTTALPPLRLGVHDVATLVFDAPFRSPFEPVRRQFAAHVTKNNLQLEPEYLENYWLAKAGVRIDARKYELPAAMDTPGFAIIRSDEMPFDFVQVNLTTAAGTRLTALVDRVMEPGDAKFAGEAALMEQWLRTRAAVAEARAARPNWRLWTLASRSGSQRHFWAEYGGRAGQSFLLRDQFGDITDHPLTSVADEEDRKVIDAGRLWLGPDGTVLVQGELASWQGENITMLESKTGTRKRTPYRLIRFDPGVDRKLIEKLITMVPEETTSLRRPRGATMRSSGPGRPR
jgi:hypothetical protein